MRREIVFSDPNFEHEVRQKLGLYDRPVTGEDALQITELDCSNFEFFEDAGMLRLFPSLISLSVESHIRILPILQCLPKLEKLDMVLWGGDKIDLSHLSQLKHLKKLFISDGDLSDVDIVNADALIGLTELRSLSFHEFGRVDLKFLERLPALEEFMCVWANEVENLDSIRSLKGLKSLCLDSIKMHDIGSLEDFPNSFSPETSRTADGAVDMKG